MKQSYINISFPTSDEIDIEFAKKIPGLHGKRKKFKVTYCKVLLSL